MVLTYSSKLFSTCTQGKNIIIHVATNHLLRDNSGITLKTQLKRDERYLCVCNITFLTQLYSIPEYSQNLRENLSATPIILMNWYFHNLKMCFILLVSTDTLAALSVKALFGSISQNHEKL